MDTVRVDGLSDAVRMFDAVAKVFPKKVAAGDIRRAAKPFLRELDASAPSGRFKGMAKAKVFTKKDPSHPVVGVGVFSNRKVIPRKPKDGVWRKLGRMGKADWVSVYFVYYWMDYGTLSNRAPWYRFRTPRRPGTAFWRGGIKPAKRSAGAWERSRGRVVEAIPKELSNGLDRFLKKNRLRYGGV